MQNLKILETVGIDLNVLALLRSRNPSKTLPKCPFKSLLIIWADFPRTDPLREIVVNHLIFLMNTDKLTVENLIELINFAKPGSKERVKIEVYLQNALYGKNGSNIAIDSEDKIKILQSLDTRHNIWLEISRYYKQNLEKLPAGILFKLYNLKNFNCKESIHSVLLTKINNNELSLEELIKCWKLDISVAKAMVTQSLVLLLQNRKNLTILQILRILDHHQRYIGSDAKAALEDEIKLRVLDENISEIQEALAYHESGNLLAKILFKTALNSLF